MRTLGPTGLPVTPVGVGLAAVGRPAYITLGRGEDLGPDRGVDQMRRRSHELLDAAFDAGVRYVDAARSYGRAEEFLAQWLDRRGLEPGALTIGSKWGYTYTGDWRMDADVQEVKDHSLAALRGQLGESRRLLGDHLRLYQIHSATLESGVLEDRAVLAELAGLRERGLVVGLTTSGPRQGETVLRALEAEVDGVNPFSTVQSTWNLLEPSAGPALERAHERGWGVLVKEAVANGRLTPHGLGVEQRVLWRVADRHGVGVDAVAVAAVLANPWVDVVLSGAVNPRQLAANLAGERLALGAEDLAELAGLALPPERYWAERGELPWV
ncbi:MAG TPA: aldo/keto reductase [Actinomycetes bacterium]|jgi:aryl-alcohol dehydrogenase-like predicted oxidoreductase|nr:aldo/keto reductase [Actinomycetes bacterium]